MKRRTTLMSLGCLALFLFSLVFTGDALPSTSTQNPLTPQESRGKEIYLLGTSRSGKDIFAYIGESSLEVPGSTMPCANCHGLTGQGRPEGGIEPSNITWEALSKPYGVTNRRKHPAYTNGALELAVTRGIDPGGNKLLYAMPRYQMSKADLDDLIAYLKRLGTETDPGISDDKMLIGTALPASGPLAEMGQTVKDVIVAYLAEVNRQGGIYNRQLDLRWVETGETSAATRANLERLLKNEKVFVMTGAFLAGAEREVVPLLAQWEVPLVGPMTLDPQTSVPLNRQVFYLLSGNSGQAQALMKFVAGKIDAVSRKLAVVYYRTDLNVTVLEALKSESTNTSATVSVYEYETSSFDAGEYVRRVRQDAPMMVFFMGSVENLLSFMRESEKVNWFPQILLQGTEVSAKIFNAPVGFDGKVFFTLPTSPTDQSAEALNEFREFAEKYKLQQKHPAAQIMAYSGTKILVEALKRVGKDLSREKLIQTLEGFYQYQTGLTPAITYGPNRRVGASGAYVVKVDLKEKKFAPASGWIAIN